MCTDWRQSQTDQIVHCNSWLLCILFAVGIWMSFQRKLNVFLCISFAKKKTYLSDRQSIKQIIMNGQEYAATTNILSEH